MEAFTVGLILTALYAMFSCFQRKEYDDTLKEYEDSLARYSDMNKKLVSGIRKLHKEKHKIELENLDLKHQLKIERLVNSVEDVSDSTAPFSMSAKEAGEAFGKISKVMSGANE